MITDQVVPQEGIPQPAGRTSRWQLAVIGAVVALAAGIGLVIGFTVLSPRGAALSGAAAYVPADAPMYMEARLDLSVDQKANLRAILERFPAVDPDDVLTDALGETIDTATSASGLPLSYSDDIATWFDGSVAVSLLDYPITSDPASVSLPSTTAMFGIKDPAAADAFSVALRDAMAGMGATFSSAEHAGVTIWSLDMPPMDAPMSMDGVGFAYAVTTDQVLMANGADAVEALLDAHGGSDSLANQDEVVRLSARLPEDWVGFTAVNTQAMFAELRAKLADQEPALAELVEGFLAETPSVAVSTFSFANDGLVFDGVSDMPGGALAPANAQRSLASAVPGDAILFADGSNIGSSLGRLISLMRAGIALEQGGDQIVRQIEQAEDAMGADLEDFVSWIGSGALAAGWDGRQVYGGLVLEAADPSAASTRLGQLRALVELGSQQTGQQITVSSADVGGVEVTTISVAAGGGDFMPMPTMMVQYAMRGETVLIGFGDGFVGRSLGLAAGESLADSDRFGAAVGRFGGTDNAGSFFLDLATLRQVVEEQAGLTQDPSYVSDIQPNLEPFDYLAMVTRVEGDAVVSRGGLVLR